MLRKMFLLMALLAGSNAWSSQPDLPDADRRQELRNLLRHDCGACHGMTLQGGLGLPLTAKALEGKDIDGLVLTILDGRPGTAMPPWRPFISEGEARWLVRYMTADRTASPNDAGETP